MYVHYTRIKSIFFSSTGMYRTFLITLLKRLNIVHASLNMHTVRISDEQSSGKENRGGGALTKGRKVKKQKRSLQKTRARVNERTEY